MANVNDIMNEIDRIEGAKSDLAGAIEEKGVEVPEGARINEYPSLVRQIEQGGTGVVRYDEAQTLSAAEQEQARTNIGAAGTKTGVISQTQTWSGSGVNRTYTMSDQVTGLIPQANIDLFERAGATFNSVSGYFELNGLTDLSYNEMMDIMRFGDMPYALASWMYQVKPIRTNFPPLRYLVNNIDTAFRDSDIEVIAFNQGANGTKLASSGAGYAFYSCRNLKKMIGVLDITTSTSGARFIQYAALLESFQIKGLKFSVEFSTPYMDKDSLLYLINNEASTGAITITLPASVYAKCQSGGEWYSDISTALAAHTNVSLASA